MYFPVNEIKVLSDQIRILISIIAPYQTVQNSSKVDHSELTDPFFLNFECRRKV